jgi:hypothetical protein
MPTVRKIPMLSDEEDLDHRSIHEGQISISHSRRFHSADPKLILYRAPGEKVIQGPEDILELLRSKGVVKDGAIRARNPITHGHYSFVAAVAQSHDALITLSIALIPAIIAWLNSRKGRRIEIQKGNLKVSAPTEKALAAALKSLTKYEKLTIKVNKAESNRKKPKAQ